MHHETWKSSVVNVDGLWLGRGGGGPPTDVGIANRDCVSWSPSLTIPSSKCSYIFKKIETTETFIYFTCYSFQSLVESVSTLLFISHQCLDAGDGSVPGPAAPGAGLLRPPRPHLLAGWLCGRSSGRTLSPPILHPRPLQQPRPTSGQSAVKLIWMFISESEF